MLNLPPLLRNIDPRVIDRELRDVVAVEDCVMEFRAPNGYLSIEGHRLKPDQKGGKAQAQLRNCSFVKAAEALWQDMWPGSVA